MDFSLRWPLPPKATRPRRWPSLLVLAAHAALVFVLWQLGRAPLVEATNRPLSVRIVDAAWPAAEPAAVLPLAAPRVPTPAMAPLAVPAIETAQRVAAERPAPAGVEPAPVFPSAALAAAPSTLTEPSPAARAAAPPPPMQVAASQLRYRVEPAVETPRAARRAGESGTVLVRVVVDLRGLPQEVSVARSSGFARLDEAALSAMRQARFVPCQADGEPVVCQADAPIVF